MLCLCPQQGVRIDRREVSDIGQLFVSVHYSVFVNICKPVQCESGTVVVVCCAGDRSVRFKGGLCDEWKLGEREDVGAEMEFEME